MQSNPSNNLHNRQRQHRRQQSTPNAFFEAVKATNLPNLQRRHSHRRGMSLDQRRRRQSPPQEFMVSNTNTGYQTTQPQHILREAQQQRLVRPGQHQFAPYDNDENYLHSPLVTPQRQSFDAGCTSQYGDGMLRSQFQFPGPINTMIDVDPNSFHGNQDFNLYQAETALTPLAYLDFSAGFENSSQGTSSQSHSRRSSSGRRISGGIMDRVAQFEHLALQSPCRPTTPPNQNVTHYFPPTPRDTPHDRMIKPEQMNQRFLDSYDTSMEETIKPRSNQRARGSFADMRKEAEMGYMASSTPPGPLPTPNSFDSAPMPTADFMNVANIDLHFMKNESLHSPRYSLASKEISRDLSFHSSHNSSPDVSQTALFDPFVNKPELDASAISYAEPPAHSLPVSSSPPRPSHHASHRRSESACSINLDESITDTGITIDDIATFIQGPDPADGKWACLYPGCKKRFGRRENIKSHVQTHLGDRQFQCPHCQKCFVRQHDLKRHAKIHSGVKPYPCQCGNSFARHDALTRHRQRGMCIGAFEGIVKKTVKRGRPRKNRPDTEERVEKSSRTRRKNQAASSASSTTGSDHRSPRSELDVLDDRPLGDYDYDYDYAQQRQSPYVQHSLAVESRARFAFVEPRSPTPSHCVSPRATQSMHSPSALSPHSQPASPAKSTRSYHSPPGLCESSSSPTASIYYDLDGGDDARGLPPSPHELGLAHLAELDHDDEMFLEAFAAASAGGEMQMQMPMHEPDPLLLAKFEDVFGPGDAAGHGGDVFRGGEGEDVFFGSP